MNKKLYIMAATIITCNTAMPLNIECVHKTIDSALADAASLEEYQEAWHTISTIYLESHQDLAPLIEHTLHTAQEHKTTLEHAVGNTDLLLSPDKLKIACGSGKLAIGMYLTLGLAVLPICYNDPSIGNTLKDCFFPLAWSAKKCLYWLTTHSSRGSIAITTIKNTSDRIAWAQWMASLFFAPYFIHTGIQKIESGIFYIDRLKNKIAIVDLIITYMETQHTELMAKK